MMTLNEFGRVLTCCARGSCLAVVAIVTGVECAQAALTENLGTSPVAMSLGNAVTADPPGIVDAVHFNPAGLSNVEGLWLSGGLFVGTVEPYASFTAPDDFSIGGWDNDPVAGTHTGPVKGALYIPGTGTVLDDLDFSVGPSLGISFNRPDSRWTFAAALFPQQGASFDRTGDPADPARFDGQKIIIQRIAYFTPSISYQLTDTLSVGLSVPISHQAVVGETDARAPNTLLGIVGELQNGWCGDGGNPLDVFLLGLCGGGQEGRLRPFDRMAHFSMEMTAPADPTVNLGILWQPRDWFALGGVYQGGSDTVLTGEYTMRVDPMLRQFIGGMYSSLLGPIAAAVVGFPLDIPEEQKGKVSMVLPYPERVQLGIKLKPIERLQINVDINWANWQSWDELTIKFDRPVKVLEAARLFGEADASQLVLSRGYTNELHFGVGVQYELTNSLTLRAGYEPRKSSIPSDAIDLIAPLPDIDMYSLGLGYVTPGGWHIDLAGGFGKGEFEVPANGSCNLNCDNFFNVVYNPYAGLDVKGGIDIAYFGLTVSKKIN